jgi:futalosine hydrolase
MEVRETAGWLKAAGKVSPTIQIEQLVTGIGQLQTAYSLLKGIRMQRPDLIVQAGIGGGSDPDYTGRVFGIRSERLADLGVTEENHFRSFFELKLGEPDRFPFSKGLLVNPHERLMAWSGLSFLEGITVNEISTDPARICALKQNATGFVESMEGAALHYVCLMEKIPFLQIRSVSNALGERDKTRWKMTEALLHLNEVLIAILKKLQTTDETLFRI